MAKVGQGIQIVVPNQVNTAAVTAVATIRSAPGNVFLATKMNHTVPAVAGNGLDCHFVYESHNSLVYILN